MKCISIIGHPSIAASLGLLAICFGGLQQAPGAEAADKPAVAPSHQVIACYFHRTSRCPTCERISDYIEEAIGTGFKAEVKAGNVKIVMMDYQKEKNQKYAQAYQVISPTLVLLDVHDGKVTSWKAAPKVWSLVARKAEFFSYVQDELRSYLDGPKAAGPKPAGK
jgi:hypothetical protein